MNSEQQKAAIAALGIACILMFTAGHFSGFTEGHTAGMNEMHDLIHTNFTKLCPTHQLTHTIEGKHVCYIDAISVRQMD